MLRLIVILILSNGYYSCISQEIITLPITKTNPEVTWEGGELDFKSAEWDTRVITNTSKPTMKVFRPEHPNGAAIVICPGGALYAHSIDSEGEWVARALNEAGVTAFVLRYRLVPTDETAKEKLIPVTPEIMFERVAEVLPLSISDGLNAIEHIRNNSEKYNIDKERIGIMGFSAGGAVTMGATYNAEAKNKPNFIAPVYFWENAQKIQAVPEDAGPAFILCATDDPLGLAPASAKLYLSWIEAGKSAELHMYSQGGHGFGLRPTDLPVGHWLTRLTDWMSTEGLMK